jgi:uncharacterized protein (TIGR02687 family)
VTLGSQQAVFPSITKFGMAALLPSKRMTVNAQLEVLLDGRVTGSTVKREAVLRARHAGSVAVQAVDLQRMKSKERRELVAGQEVVYIYHNAIDAIGDKAMTETKVFEACETAIEELTNLVRIVTNDLSAANVYITADHGFLYTYSPLAESEKVSARQRDFAGEVYEVGRRYALTARDTTAEYLLPVEMEREIGGVPLKGYAPRDNVRLKMQGGGENYVHGGISLQELVVPVIGYKALRAGARQFVEVKNPGLQLINMSRKLSNLSFSLDFLQTLPVGDKVQPCTYTVQFTDQAGYPVSDVHTVVADRMQSDAAERVQRVRFNLKPAVYDRTQSYRLVIAGGTDVPVEVEYQLDIAAADDLDSGVELR